MARPQTVALVGLWAGATGLAVGMATAGVNLVADQVTQPSPVIIPGPLTDAPTDLATPLSAAEPASPSPSNAPTSRPAPVAVAPSATKRPTADPTTPVEARPTTTDDDDRDRRGEPRRDDDERDDERDDDADDDTADSEDTADDDTADSEDTADVDTADDEDTTDEDTAEEAVESETRTVRVQGGQAGFRFTGDEIELLWASPADGFTVKVLKRESDRIEMVFRSRDHESFIEARADEDDGPRIKTEEESRDPDDEDDD